MPKVQITKKQNSGEKLTVWMSGNVQENFLFNRYLSKEEFSQACFIRQMPYKKTIRTGSFKRDDQLRKACSTDV